MSEADSIANPKRRGNDKRGLLAMIDNGVGLRLSRLMIIGGFPIVSWLLLSWFNATMANLTLQFDQIRRDVRLVSDGLVDVHSDVKEVKDKLTDTQMQIVRLQSAQEDRRSHP